ncbi:hypothetical protein M0R04_09230 [Candidatus Dojkabacteria bacterium]|jgi:hypothetical protein|nr:hypothetical protein [Candidatus Dojkabacteria bacterium]
MIKTKLKLCIDCAHFIRSSQKGGHTCRVVFIEDPVDGEKILSYCSTARSHKVCGLEGKLWVAAVEKEDKP